MIKIKDNEILLFGMNMVGFLFSISYLILFTTGTMALEMSAIIFPLGESGISVLLVFGRLFYAVAMFCILGMDIAWTVSWWVKEQENKEKGWL